MCLRDAIDIAVTLGSDVKLNPRINNPPPPRFAFDWVSVGFDCIGASC